MEYLIGVQNQSGFNVGPIKLKYLSMRMNTTLGFKFQRGLLKLLEDSVA